MKHNKKKTSTLLPIMVGIGVCATSIGVAVNSVPTIAYAANSNARVSTAHTAQANPDTPNQKTPIVFKDQNLKNSLLKYMKDRKIIKADAQDITPAQAEKLGPVAGDVTNTYRLTFGSHEIKDLTGMQYFKNLTELELDNNQIEEIKPLAALTKLTFLGLGQNKISDITPLAQMNNLKDLQLNDNQIKDITSLQNLTELTDLSLARNQISSATPLAGLTKLTNLDMSTNQIGSLEPLKALTAMQDLDLEQNDISDITPLAALTKVTNLKLGGNHITQIDTLKNLTKLNSLLVEGNEISDISALQGLAELTELNAASNNIEKLDAIKGLKKLTKLNVYTNFISDISPVKELRNLTEFYVYDQTIKLKSNAKETPLALKYADKLKFTVQDANKSDGKVENAKFILNKFPHTGDVNIDFSSDDNIDGISITDLNGNISNDKMCYTGTITISYDAQNPNPPAPKPPVQNQKTVTFKNGNNILATVKVETGHTVVAQSMPQNPTTSGYTFKEWNTSQDGQGKAFTADTTVSEDLIVYAIYTKNPVTPPQPPTPTPQPPAPQHDSSAPAVMDTQEAEVLPGKMKYEADDTLPYNTQKKISDPVEGLKVITHTGSFVNGVWVPSEKVEITDAKDGLTKVGNKQVTHDGDKTITTTYTVNPDTGELTNPQTHTSMSWSELIPAKPVAPDTDHHESDNSGDNTGTNAGDNAGTNSDANAGTNAATDAPALSQPKHMRQTPKTGDAGNIAELFSFLGASVLSLSFMHQRTKMTKRK